MADAVMSIHDLDVGYDDKVVVSGFTLDIAPGEFVSLLGPSGCGKTTILRAIAGFLKASRGSIKLESRDITRLPAEQRDVGIVFQNYALFPTMSAFENIAFGLRVSRTSSTEIARRVETIARASGIDEHLDKKPANLSGGQQQRVAIARALVMGAKVLLLDEPLSNLDAKMRVAMRREIRRLQAELGFTAIYVTHDQEEALSLSDRVVLLRDGQIEQIGSGRELYHHPRTPFVCDFLGESNAISGALASQLGIAADTGARCFLRYEDVLLEFDGDAGMAGEIAHVEFLGAMTRVDCLLQDEMLSATVDDRSLPADIGPGRPVCLSARSDAAHVFARAIA